MEDWIWSEKRSLPLTLLFSPSRPGVSREGWAESGRPHRRSVLMGSALGAASHATALQEAGAPKAKGRE